MGTYPNFCTTLIGSMPRSPELLELKRQAAHDKKLKKLLNFKKIQELIFRFAENLEGITL